MILLVSVSTVLSAQSTKVKGLIKARNGPNLILQVPESPDLNVLLNDTTQVGQIQGVFQARKKEMSMAYLIPGLAVEVEGIYTGQNELTAKSVKFKGNDLKQAQAIQAGMHETRTQTDQNTSELQKQGEQVQKQGAELDAQQQKLASEGRLD